MRHSVVAGLFAIGLLAVGSSASAAATQSRYCLQGNKHGQPGPCHFATLQQCQATLSGRGGRCVMNPRYAFARAPRGTQR
jgi:hypothetical protein